MVVVKKSVSINKDFDDFHFPVSKHRLLCLACLHDIILVSIPTRLFLHDDVHEGLSDVRRKAVEDMKKLREKSGTLKGLVRLLD